MCTYKTQMCIDMCPIDYRKPKESQILGKHDGIPERKFMLKAEKNHSALKGPNVTRDY